MISVRRIVFVLFAFGSTACSGSSTAPTPAAAAVTFTQTDLRAGTGTEATAGRRLTVNYTGWLYDSTKSENKGAQFDSSLNAGRSPFVFTLGAGSVIRGWDVGLVGMKVGGQRRLIIPPDLGYGSSGSGQIPPNAALVFDVDLLDVQ